MLALRFLILNHQGVASDPCQVASLLNGVLVCSRLKDWEAEINADSVESALLKVENDVDLEGPPRHMTYINAYKVELCLHKQLCKIAYIFEHGIGVLKNILKFKSLSYWIKQKPIGYKTYGMVQNQNETFSDLRTICFVLWSTVLRF